MRAMRVRLSSERPQRHGTPLRAVGGLLRPYKRHRHPRATRSCPCSRAGTDRATGLPWHGVY